MPINYDSSGLTTQTLAEIVQERETSCQSFLGNNFQITGDTVVGNLQAADSDREYDIQELMAFLVGQLSLSNSSGIFLDWNAKFKNLTRIAPQKTKITRTINGTVGTVVSSLTILDTNLNEEFILTDSVTIASNGKIQGTFESIGYGFLNVLTGDTFTIVTPVLGVTSISFVTGDGTTQEGNDAETDEVFRARAISTNNINSIAISSAIKAKLLELDGVDNVTYIENNTDNYMYETYTSLSGTITCTSNSFTITGTDTTFLTDLNINDSIKFTDDLSNEVEFTIASIESDTSLTTSTKITVAATDVNYSYALPTLSPKSFEMIVLGGDEEEIATIILDNKVPTTTTYGNTSVDIADSEGTSVNIKFSVPEQIPIIMQANVYCNSTLATDERDALKSAFEEYWTSAKLTDSSKGIGMDIDAGDFGILSNTNPKIQKIRSIQIKKSGDTSWATDDYIILGIREIATLSASNITFNYISA